jgi:hypothetical protein
VLALERILLLLGGWRRVMEIRVLRRRWNYQKERHQRAGCE